MPGRKRERIKEIMWRGLKKNNQISQLI